MNTKNNSIFAQCNCCANERDLFLREGFDGDEMYSWVCKSCLHLDDLPQQRKEEMSEYENFIEHKL
ncbi:MAG: hypothetical protein SFW66_09080 [Gammaproteobacteria bacterium]|nr:hypothetical protein [Gammaproteobacteria bacterium]